MQISKSPIISGYDYANPLVSSRKLGHSSFQEMYLFLTFFEKIKLCTGLNNISKYYSCAMKTQGSHPVSNFEA
jgi:hypothetical protein